MMSWGSNAVVGRIFLACAWQLAIKMDDFCLVNRVLEKCRNWKGDFWDFDVLLEM